MCFLRNQDWATPLLEFNQQINYTSNREKICNFIKTEVLEKPEIEHFCLCHDNLDNVICFNKESRDAIFDSIEQ